MEITCATSFDERFDPKNVLNNNMNEIWITTGMFPQELTITFDSKRTFHEIKFVSTGIKNAHIKGCASMNGNGFNLISEPNEIPNAKG